MFNIQPSQWTSRAEFPPPIGMSSEPANILVQYLSILLEIDGADDRALFAMHGNYQLPPLSSPSYYQSVKDRVSCLVQVPE
jgi:hypothetical protein